MNNFDSLERNKSKLKILTCNLPICFIELMESMRRVGLIPSRSEFIRQAVWDKLNKDLKLIETVLEGKVNIAEYESRYETPESITIAGTIYYKR